MLSYEDRIRMYRGKKLFIEHISKVFEDPILCSNVKKVEFEVYSKYHPDYDTTHYAEFVVVTFEGGAISVRNISGNSNNANFRAVSQLIDGGYYDEVEYYNGVKKNCEIVNLEG